MNYIFKIRLILLVVLLISVGSLFGLLTTHADQNTIIGYSVSNAANYGGGEYFDGTSVPIYDIPGTGQLTYIQSPACYSNSNYHTNCGYTLNQISISSSDTVQLTCYGYDFNGNDVTFPGPKFTGPGTFYASSYGSIVYSVQNGYDQSCVVGVGLSSSNGYPYFDADYITVLSNGAPTSLVATANNHAETELSWVDNSSTATGYVVERATSGGSFVASNTILPANTTTFINSNLPPETAYQYRVRAVLPGGTYSVYSNTASITTLPPLPTPALTVTKVSNTNIALNWSITSSAYWTAYSSAEIVGYKVWRRIGPTGVWTQIATVNGGQTITYNDTSPVSGGLNYYEVDAYDDTSVSGLSDDWYGSYADITPPAVPVLSLEPFFIYPTVTGLPITPMVRVVWTASTDDNDNRGDGTFIAWSYNLFRYQNGSKLTLPNSFLSFGTDSNGQMDYNNGLESSSLELQIGSTYCYTASAYDINILLAHNNNNYNPQNTSSESSQTCITIPNPPSGASAPTIQSVTPSTSGSNTFNVSGSGLSSSGNSVILTPTSPTSMVQSSTLQANSSSAFDVLINFFKNIIPVSHGQTSTNASYGSYTVSNLSSPDGSSLTFTVPSSVPNGTYTVSLLNADALEINTTNIITVSGNNSASTGGTGSGTTCQTGYTLSGTTCVPIATGSLPTSVAGTSRSSISATSNTTYTYTEISGNFQISSCVSPGVVVADPNIAGKDWCQFPNVSYSCPAGYVVSGTTCNPSPAYSCPSGYILNSSTCIPNLTPQSFAVTLGTGTNTGYINVTWTNPTYALTAKNVYIESTNDGSTYIVAATGPATWVSYSTLFGPNTAMGYRIRILYTNGAYGPYTSSLFARTPSLPPAPVLTATTSSATPSSVILTWTGSSDQFYVYSASSSNPIASTLSKTYTVNNLAYSTNYCFAVAVYDNSQYKSSASNIVCVTTPTFPSPIFSSAVNSITKKNSLGQNVVTPIQGSIFLKGSTPAGLSTAVTITGISIERSTNVTSGFSEIVLDKNTDITSSSWSFTDTTVSASSSLNYRVRYLLSDGSYGQYSSVLSVTSATPVAPALTIPTKAETSLGLSWTINTKDNGNPSYSVISSTGSTHLVTLASTTLKYTVSNLIPSTQYCYTVNLVYNPANTTPSTQVCATTAKSTAPGSLAAKVSGQQINLSWSATGLTGNTSVERSISKTTGFIQIGTASSTSYIDNAGLAPSTIYYYRVRKMYNDGSFGIYSSVVNAKTAAASTKAVMNTNSTSNITTDTSSITTTTPVNTYSAVTPSATTTPVAPISPTKLTPAQILQNTLNGNKANTNQSNINTPTTPSSATTTKSSIITPTAVIQQSANPVPATVTYTCETGYTKVNQKCIRVSPPSVVQPTASYSCPIGSVLDNSNKTCIQSTSAAFATSTTTASVFDSLVGWFTDLFK